MLDIFKEYFFAHDLDTIEEQHMPKTEQLFLCETSIL
jgi:hypothetical protein